MALDDDDVEELTTRLFVKERYQPDKELPSDFLKLSTAEIFEELARQELQSS